MHERQNLYNPLFKYTGVAVCPHAKFGSMTVITYSEDFKETDKTVQGIETTLTAADARGTADKFDPYPTCAPVTCSKYSFVKEIDCEVFYEQNRMRQFPKSWLRRLVAFKYAPENQMFLKRGGEEGKPIDIDAMIWRLEDAITKLDLEEAKE